MVTGTQKVLFLCNCCSTTLVPSLNDQSCCSGTTGRAKKAEWRQNHCHGGQVLPWSLNGGTVVTTVITQWTPLVGQRRHNGGTRKADVSLKLIHNVRIFYWRPMADHCAQNFMATMASLAMSEHPICHPWTTRATVRPPFCLHRQPGQFCDHTREA